ncbi:MAG: hypothetical protein QOH81_174 [Sphingomonadales bacterium]|jgi:hypothetical protein|nr:hypothetical protein [Sphingomonadales bacterium]
MIGTPNVLSGGQHIPIIKSGMTIRDQPGTCPFARSTSPAR